MLSMYKIINLTMYSVFYTLFVTIYFIFVDKEFYS